MANSKQEYAVRKHMIENERYNQKEIDDVDGSGSKDDEYFSAIVRMRNGKHYISV